MLRTASLLLSATVLLIGLSACTTAQVQKVQTYHDQIAAACSVAMFLAPVAGPVAPWIIGGCSTEAAIAKLALDSNSLNWLTKLIADARKP
jgi:Ca2+/H+ antiporter